MNKKKIAVFIDWFLPAYKAGGPITSVANLVEALKNDFDFYIITSDRDLGDDKPFGKIEFNKWIDKQSYKIIYLSPENQNIKQLKKLLYQQNFDYVYINSFWDIQFGINPIIAAKNNYPTNRIILAPRGMLSRQSFSRKKLRKRLCIFVAKILGIYKGITFHATNQNEADDISSFFKNKIIIASNLPKINSGKTLVIREKSKNKLNLVSIARISQEKNTLFALKILSKIQDYSINFDLYGIYDEKYWLQCQEIIRKMPENINVNYKGAIPSSAVFDTFSKYHFAFMPSIGENFGHSIYEAMSAGCPVIISDKTPWRNLEQKGIGWDITLNNEQKFIEVIEYCAKMEQKEYEEMSQKVYKFAKDYLKNSGLIEQAKKLFQ